MKRYMIATSVAIAFLSGCSGEGYHQAGHVINVQRCLEGGVGEGIICVVDVNIEGETITGRTHGVSWEGRKLYRYCHLTSKGSQCNVDFNFGLRSKYENTLDEVSQ